MGLSGRDRESAEPSYVHYLCKNLGKKDGDYLNSNDMLLQNFNDEFYFLGTGKSIEFQKELLDLKDKNVTFIEIEDNSLDEIYEQILILLEKSTDDVILDVTHGFRHQPISAVFAATFYRFLNHTQLRVIFAKEIMPYTKYEYIYLNDYLDLSQLTFQLSGFIQTLNFVESAPIQGFDTSAFLRFSDALLSNDFAALCKNYEHLKKVIDTAKTDKRYKHLSHLFVTIEKDLSVFETFDNKAMFAQYLAVAELMLSKNYLLLALTYMYEAIRFYSSRAFYKYKLIEKDVWQKGNHYKVNQEVITFITQKDFKGRYNKTNYDRNYPLLFSKNENNFKKISSLYVELRNLRNNLTHINPKETKFSIELRLEKLLLEIKDMFKEDILNELKY